MMNLLYLILLPDLWVASREAVSSSFQIYRSNLLAGVPVVKSILT